MNSLAMTQEETNAYWLGRSDAIKEMRQARTIKRKIEAARRRRAIHFLKQKACGAAMLAISVLIPVILDGDATASLITMPLGIYLMCTKEVVLETSYFYEIKEKQGNENM